MYIDIYNQKILIYIPFDTIDIINNRYYKQ